MRKKPPSADPVYRRIHGLVANATARRILRRVYEEDGAIFSGHFAKAIIHLRDLNLVRFEVTWNGERRGTDWRVQLTARCSRMLNTAKALPPSDSSMPVRLALVRRPADRTRKRR